MACSSAYTPAAATMSITAEAHALPSCARSSPEDRHDRSDHTQRNEAGAERTAGCLSYPRFLYKDVSRLVYQLANHRPKPPGSWLPADYRQIEYRGWDN